MGSCNCYPKDEVLSRTSNESRSVDELLQGLGLPQYIDAFRSNGFERVTDVRLITESDLNTMGVLLGHRRRILDAVLTTQNDPLTMKPPDPPAAAQVDVTQPATENVTFSPPEGSMHIFVKTLTGKTMTFDVFPSTSIAALRNMIQDHGIPLEQQRIFFGGRQISKLPTPMVKEFVDPYAHLWDGRKVRMSQSQVEAVHYAFESLVPDEINAEYADFRGREDAEQKKYHESQQLSDCGIERDSTLHVVLALRGDIGTFGDHVESPGIGILENALALKKQQQHQQVSQQDLIQIVRDVYLRCERVPNNGGSIFGNAFHCPPGACVLSARARQSLLQLLEHQYSSNDEHQVADLKLDLSETQLVNAIGEQEFVILSAAFGGPFSAIKLRRVSAIGQCINFHLDNSKKTMQVPLNEETEYDGGKLVYLTEQGIETPSRPAGSFTLHDNTIVHGVSHLRCGTRASLFLLLE